MARPICFRLLTHWERRAASRAAWTAGRSRAISTAMIAMTTRSSIRVKPLLREIMRRALGRVESGMGRFLPGRPGGRRLLDARPLGQLGSGPGRRLGVEVAEDVVSFQRELEAVGDAGHVQAAAEPPEG